MFALGLATAAMGIYVGNADDAPGAGVMGFVVMAAGVVLGVRAARNRLSIWAGRTALMVGVLVAAFAAFLTHAVTVAAPLFEPPPDVPSVSESAPSPQWATAVDRARPLVRAAIVDQNLPGVSVAVGAGGTIVWAEGFGWRDVATRTPVTPATRFNVGTAASAVTAAAVAQLALTNTGAESAAGGVPAISVSPKRISRSSRSSTTSSSARSASIPRSRCRAIAPRSTSRDPMTTIPAADDD